MRAVSKEAVNRVDPGLTSCLDVQGPVRWDSGPGGLVTHGSNHGVPTASPQGFDPTTLPTDFTRDESGGL